MASPGRAVFLSYASEDANAAARLSSGLRAAGLEVWFDQAELRGGDAWDQTIRQKIRDCRLFIPIISTNTEARLEGYFRREWKLAADRMDDMASKVAFVLPVVIDQTANGSADVPDRFRQLQWTRLAEGEPNAAFVDRLKSLTGSHVPGGTVTSSLQAATSTSAPAAPSRRRYKWLAALVLLCVLSAAVFVVAKLAVRKDAPRATSSGDSERSIAVLPFTDLSESHDQAYFAEGMAEEVLDLLSRVPTLNVIGKTSALQVKDQAGDARSIGVTLGVANILEGSVRKAGNRIRVNATLIDAKTGARRWSDSYDRALNDVLTLQADIAAAISRELEVTVDAQSIRSKGPLVSAEAYTHYLRGRYAYDRLDEEGMANARTQYEQALSLDPTFARAAEALALTYVQGALNQLDDAATAWLAAQKAAELALRLDPQSTRPHAVLAMVYSQFQFNWERADAELQLALAERDPETLDLAAHLAIEGGNFTLALQRIEASLAIDPLNPYVLQRKGILFYLSGNYPSAELALRKSLAVSPTFWASHAILSWVLNARGNLDESLREAKLEPSDGGRDVSMAVAYHALGRIPEYQAIKMNLEKRVPVPEDSGWPMGRAMLYAYVGDTEHAFRWLEGAYRIRDPDLLLWIKNCPLVGPLKPDPRYAAYLRKLNLPD